MQDDNIHGSADMDDDQKVIEEDDDQNFGYGEEMGEDPEMHPGLIGMGEGEDDEELDMGEGEPQLIDEEQFM